MRPRARESLRPRACMTGGRFCEVSVQWVLRESAAATKPVLMRRLGEAVFERLWLVCARSAPPRYSSPHSQPTAYCAHATQPTVPSAKRSQSATGVGRRSARVGGSGAALWAAHPHTRLGRAERARGVNTSLSFTTARACPAYGFHELASWSWSCTSHPHAHLHAQLGLISASAQLHHRRPSIIIIGARVRMHPRGP